MRSRLKDELGPGLDNSFAWSLEDLDALGVTAGPTLLTAAPESNSFRG